MKSNKMSIGQKFIQVLRLFDFVKVAWDKCPQGYEESNYQCFYHKESDTWAEVYLSDAIPYMWIVSRHIELKSICGGQFVDDSKKLKTILTKIDAHIS